MSDGQQASAYVIGFDRGILPEENPAAVRSGFI